jgi:vacuolar-type H+-ATPase subunit E/Vma4
MNLIQRAVTQIRKESLKNYYDVNQAEEELGNMLQSHRLYKLKEMTLNFIKQISGKDGSSYTIRQTGAFLSEIINELKIKYEIKE